VKLNGTHVSLEDATVERVYATPMELVVSVTTWDGIRLRIRVREPLEFTYRPSGELSFVEIATPEELQEPYSRLSIRDEHYGDHSSVDVIRFVGSDDSVIVCAISPRGSEPVFEIDR